MNEKKGVRPGRPRVLSHEERRSRILAAAERIFVEAGYGATTMAAIARESGMSKKTLYQFFPDKLTIFFAIVRDCDFSFAAPTKSVNGSGVAEVREVLIGMSTSSLSARRVAMTRLVIAEAQHSPELARSFYDNCMQRGLELVSDRLRKVHTDTLQGLDVELVADILLGATLVALQMRTLICGSDPTVIHEDLEKRVDAVLRFILGSRSTEDGAHATPKNKKSNQSNLRRH